MRMAIEAVVDLGEHCGLVILRATEHHTGDMLQMLLCSVQAFDTAIDGNLEWGEPRSKAIDPRIVERRDGAVLFRRESLQPCLAGVHVDVARAGIDHLVDEDIEAL